MNRQTPPGPSEPAPHGFAAVSDQPPAPAEPSRENRQPGGWTNFGDPSVSLPLALSGASDDFGFGVGPQSVIAPGTTLGDVTILRFIGAGGMGSVYEARQHAPDRVVAVKVIRDGILSAKQLQRFEYEAQVLARLSHPHIATIHMFGTGRIGPFTVPYFVMELVHDARPLTQYCDERGIMARGRVALMRRVCAAVAHGHHKGVIHRDLKPGNILVDGTGEPKVIDFGVARSTDDGMAAATMLTAAGHMVGTLHYMSPEQFAGAREDVDARSDVHALGLVLHELLAGELPYDLRGRSIVEAARIVSTVEPPIAATVAVAARRDRTISADDARSLGVIVARCLEKRPADRYATAADVEAELSRWFAGEPILARPPSLLRSLERLARRHRAAAVAAAAVLATLVAAVVGISSFAARAEREGAAARAQLYRATVLLAADARNRGAISEARRLLGAAKGLAGDAGAAEPIELAWLTGSLDESSAVCAGHEGAVRAVAWSPDGSRLATAADDGTARLRPGEGVAGSATTVVLTGHTAALWTLDFSPDGRRVATGSADATARVWDAATGEEVLRLSGHEGVVYGVDFAPDGRRLATCGRDGTVRLWNAATGDQAGVVSREPGTVYAVRFSPDGRLLATAGRDGRVRLWDATTGEPRGACVGHTQRAFCVVFSPGGDRLASTSEDGTVRIWDVASARPMATLAHPFKTNAAAFTADGCRVVTASDDGLLRWWNVDTGALDEARCGHEAAVWSVAACSDGKWLATGSADGSARLWSAEAGGKTRLGCGEKVRAAAWSADGASVAIGTAAGVRLWSLDGRAEPSRLCHDGVQVNDVCFLPDGRRLAAACDAGAVVIRPTAGSGEDVRVIPAHARRVYSVDADRSGTWLASAGEDRTARIWSLAEPGTAAAATFKHSRRVLCARFSPDGRRLLTACEDRIARAWDIASGREAVRFEGHAGPVNWVAITSSGRVLATASSDHTVRLWDAATGTLRSVLTGPARQVRKVAFTPDGSRVIAVVDDGTAHIWDAASGEAVSVLRAHDAEAWAVAVHPDGRSLVTGGWDGAARLWGHTASRPSAEDLCQRVLEHAGAALEALQLLGPQLEFHDLLGATPTDHRGHRDRHVAEAVGAAHDRRDGEHPLRIERDRMDHLGDRHAHGEAGPGLLLDHLRAARLGPLEDVFAELVREPRPLLQWQAGDRGARPHRHHAVAVLADDHRLHLRGRGLEIHRQQAAEAECVEERAEPDDAALRQPEFLLGQERENVDRIADDQDRGIGAMPLGLDGGEDRLEQLDVAVDERQPAFVGLAPQAGGDADQVGVGEAFVASRGDRLVGDRRRAVKHVERLAIGEVGIGIDDHDLVHDAAELQGEARRRAHDPTAADDADFHVMLPK